MLILKGQLTKLEPGDIAKVDILGFGLSKLFLLRNGEPIKEKRIDERPHHIMPASDKHSAYVALHLVALCAGLGIKYGKDSGEEDTGVYLFEFTAPEENQISTAGRRENHG